MDISMIFGMLTVLAFVVNILVQVLKGMVPIPTKVLCLIVALAVNIASLIIFESEGYIAFDLTNIVVAVMGSPVIAFISMYGFDTFKELWERFKNGEDIDEG